MASYILYFRTRTKMTSDEESSMKMCFQTQAVMESNGNTCMQLAFFNKMVMIGCMAEFAWPLANVM